MTESASQRYLRPRRPPRPNRTVPRFKKHGSKHELSLVSLNYVCSNLTKANKVCLEPRHSTTLSDAFVPAVIGNGKARSRFHSGFRATRRNARPTDFGVDRHPECYKYPSCEWDLSPRGWIGLFTTEAPLSLARSPQITIFLCLGSQISLASGDLLK